MAVVTNAAYGYSSAGCVTSVVYSGASYSQGLAMDWNGLYQLTSVKTNGATAESYGWDALGRRVFISQGSATNYMVYDGQQVIADVNATGGLVRSYAWAPGIDRLLAMTVYSGTTGTTYFAISDHLGTVHALANTNGVIVESYRFDAFGRVLDVFGSNGQAISQSAIGNRFLWAGKEYSWATGLYHNRARTYDPITGRFLSKDPSGISGGLNEYVYCSSDPVNQIDWSGLAEELVQGSVALPNGRQDYSSPYTSIRFAALAAANTHSGVLQWKERGGLIYRRSGSYYWALAPLKTSGHLYSQPGAAIVYVPKNATVVGTWHTHPSLSETWQLSGPDWAAVGLYRKGGIFYHMMIGPLGGNIEVFYDANGDLHRNTDVDAYSPPISPKEGPCQ
jgi:RHS repeat-associated protein